MLKSFKKFLNRNKVTPMLFEHLNWWYDASALKLHLSLLISDCNRLMIKAKSKEGYKSTKGVCLQLGFGIPLKNHFKERKLLEHCFESWEKYSGSLIHPVPSPFEGMTPKVAYSCMPLYEGKYGELRLELLQHIISELKKLQEYID